MKKTVAFVLSLLMMISLSASSSSASNEEEIGRASCRERVYVSV